VGAESGEIRWEVACEVRRDAGFVGVQSIGGLNDEPFRLGPERLVMVGTKP
jgi:hypothetical protein